MKLLAFDTSTSIMSVALSFGADVWHHQGEGGALASTNLIPQVLRLMAEAGLAFADLDAIAFGNGPGSFTGLRTACSVAQGFGFGANVPLLPVDTLLAVAEDARMRYGVTRVSAALDARMDEIYCADYVFGDPGHASHWQRIGDFCLLRPEELVVMADGCLAGNVHAAYAGRLPQARYFDALPSAMAMLRLAPQLLASGAAVSAEQARPRYVRDKVAKTTDERLADRAVQNQHP